MFDFQKAINGEPIYLDGSVINTVLYNPYLQLFETPNGVFNIYGNHINESIKLKISTDRQKNKVMVTAYVYENGSTGGYMIRDEKLESWYGNKFLGQISGEVEI